MKFLPIACVCILLSISSIGQEKAKKVLFIIADGIPADVIERVTKPNINKIIEAGNYKRAFVGGIKGTYSQTPTISAPGYNNLLTGTWANKHQVLNNTISKPNYQYWTIFRYLKNAYPNKKTAVFSTWTDNRTKLIGDGLAQTGGYTIDMAFDGYELDTLRFVHDKKSNYIHQIDELVVSKADSTIRASAPDLSWVYLEYTDDMGHQFGDGAMQDQSIGYLDNQIKKLTDAIAYRTKNFAEDWLLVLTTDHGRDPIAGKNHGGQTDRERTTWIVTNQANTNAYFKQSNPAIVDILPSIATFLKIPIPEKNKVELDGVSFFGPISIAQPSAAIVNDSLVIKWKSFEKKGKVQVKIATTNAFKDGGEDVYQNIATVNVTQEGFTLSTKQFTSNYFKIVLVGTNNSLNIWVKKPE
jgi:predicted AlkP superfamily pyrophosphatase or phosphodiesterase